MCWCRSAVHYKNGSRVYTYTVDEHASLDVNVLQRVEFTVYMLRILCYAWQLSAWIEVTDLKISVLVDLIMPVVTGGNSKWV